MFGCGTFRRFFSQRCRIIFIRIMFLSLKRNLYEVLPFLDQSISCSTGSVRIPPEASGICQTVNTHLHPTRLQPLVRNLQTGPLQLLRQPDCPSTLVGPAWWNEAWMEEWMNESEWRRQPREASDRLNGPRFWHVTRRSEEEEHGSNEQLILSAHLLTLESFRETSDSHIVGACAAWQKNCISLVSFRFYAHNKPRNLPLVISEANIWT